MTKKSVIERCDVISFRIPKDIDDETLEYINQAKIDKLLQKKLLRGIQLLKVLDEKVMSEEYSKEIIHQNKAIDNRTPEQKQVQDKLHITNTTNFNKSSFVDLSGEDDIFSSFPAKRSTLAKSNMLKIAGSLKKHQM